MDRKELIVVLVLVLLVALAGTVRLFSTPLAPSDDRAKRSPLRGIAPVPPRPGAPRGAAPIRLWPPLDRNLRPQDSAAQQLFDAAETLASEGLFDAAIAAYRRFAERFPLGLPAEFALLRVAQCYTLARRYRDAMANYDLFLERHPDSGYRPLALLWSADALIRLGYKEPARKRLEEVLARHPLSRFAEGARNLLDTLGNPTPPLPRPDTP